MVDSWTMLAELPLVRDARRSATAVGLASTAVICGEAAGEHAGEEADAGEEVPGEGAGAGLVFVVADQLDEGFEEEAVGLEEAAAGDPVGFVEHAVVEAGGSGFGDEAAGGAGADVEGSGGGGGDEHALRGVGLQRDGHAVERAEEGLGAGSAEEGDLDALHGVVAEELDFGGGVEPVGGVAVLGGGREQALGGGPEDGRGDEAGGDGKEVGGGVAVVAEAERAGGVCVVAVAEGAGDAQADAVAIAPGFGGVEDGLGWGFDAGVAKELGKDGLLEAKLLRVVGHLVMAAAAGAEVRAGGRDALGGGGEDAEELGLIAGVGGAGFDGFAGEGEGDQNRCAAGRVGEAVAAVKDAIDVEGLAHAWGVIRGTCRTSLGAGARGVRADACAEIVAAPGGVGRRTSWRGRERVRGRLAS